MILSLGAGIESWLAHGTKSREQYQGSNPAEHPWLLNSMVTYSDLRGTANEHSLWRPCGCLSSNGWTVMDSDGHDWAISWRVMAVCIHPFDLKLECLEPARSAAGPENCPVRMHIPGEGRRLSATTWEAFGHWVGHAKPARHKKPCGPVLHTSTYYVNSTELLALIKIPLACTRKEGMSHENIRPHESEMPGWGCEFTCVNGSLGSCTNPVRDLCQTLLRVVSETETLQNRSRATGHECRGPWKVKVQGPWHIARNHDRQSAQPNSSIARCIFRAEIVIMPVLTE